MNRILMVVLALGFSMTTSCAHKKDKTPADVVVVTDKEKLKQHKLEKETTPTTGANTTYTCDVQGDKRTVILDKGKTKCTVNYTKFGEAKEVASARKNTEICATTFKKIRTNIEAAGFKCIDGQAKIEKTDTAMIK